MARRKGLGYAGWGVEEVLLSGINRGQVKVTGVSQASWA